MNNERKTREQVKAEREAKKVAKAAAKNKKNDADGNKGIPESKKADSGHDLELSSVQKQQTDDSKSEIDSLTADIANLSLENQQKIIPSLIKSEGKSKSELRAERRTKQEAQRAVKSGNKGQKSESSIKSPESSSKVPEKSSRSPDVPDKDKKGPKIDNLSERNKTDAKQMSSKPNNASKLNSQEGDHEINLFKHLYHEREQAFINDLLVNSSIHSSIVRLGIQYSSKVIVGSNARCIAFLAALKQLIRDYDRPSKADFTRGLERSFQESIAYLHHCRPLAVSMMNALRHLKWMMCQLPATISDKEAKNKLDNAIDTYVNEQILLADEAISMNIRTKISKNDVILTYGYSSLIQKVLCDAYDAGCEFHVAVVDGRPWLEGKELLRRLTKHGVSCSYILINALSFIMPEVNKVFLGAHAILANGAVMSRAGTAQVALMANAFRVPVLVACETHKSYERVLTDSIVYNEIGNADELVQPITGCNSSTTDGSNKKCSLANWRTKKSLNLLNISYDVTPADLVTAVVTELAILPCTSVPVILRIKPSEI